MYTVSLILQVQLHLQIKNGKFKGYHQVKSQASGILRSVKENFPLIGMMTPGAVFFNSNSC